MNFVEKRGGLGRFIGASLADATVLGLDILSDLYRADISIREGL